MSFGDFVRGKVGFDVIGDKITGVFDSIKANGDIEYWTGKLEETFKVLPRIAWLGVAIAASLIVVFLGKRLLTFMKYVAAFALGFLVGATFLAPPITSVVSAIPWWAVGLAVGAVSFILARMIYFFLYIGAFGLGAYIFCTHGYILKDMLAENWMIGAAAAAVVVILALICKNVIEMLGTASLGAWGVSASLLAILGDFQVIPTDGITAKVINISVIAILAVLGLVVQFKTRVRKW